jgi:dihydropteroate synthase
MLPLVAKLGVPVVLMHMQGTPATMQVNPSYGDVVKEVREFLSERIGAAEKAGISRAAILVDPGIGFGKKMEHNLALIRRVGEFKALDRPMVVGVSRKGFIGTITGEPVAANRLFGTAAAVAWTVANGADIVRVHDVKAMVQVVKMTRAIMQQRPED